MTMTTLGVPRGVHVLVQGEWVKRTYWHYAPLDGYPGVMLVMLGGEWQRFSEGQWRYADDQS